MNNIQEVVKKYYDIKQQIKALEKEADELLKPQIKTFYTSSGIQAEQDLEVEGGFFINMVQALKETFDLKKARAVLNKEILSLVDNDLLVKRTQYPILKVDVKPIATKKVEAA